MSIVNIFNMSSGVKKRKKGQVLNNNERQLILNLMSYQKEKHADRSISEIIREISKATGCSERTIYKIKKNASKGISFVENKIHIRKNENKNSRKLKYDSYIKSSIRRKVYDLIIGNSPPTLNTILTSINRDSGLPHFKRSTLYTLLKEIGFTYEQKGKKSFLTETNDLVQIRQEYLKCIQRFRNENRSIIFTGQTIIKCWKSLLSKSFDVKGQKSKEDKKEATSNVPEIISEKNLVGTVNASVLISLKNFNNSSEKICEDEMIFQGVPLKTESNVTKNESKILQSADAAKSGIYPLSLEPVKHKIQPDKNFSFKIMHACSDQGFLQNVEYVTVFNNEKKDINCYENWFLKKLLPKTPPNSVVVTDINALEFDNRKRYQMPNNTWKKQQIKNWLLSNNASVKDSYPKKELLAMVSNISSFSCDFKYKITEMAKEKAIILINLPPFHYELNPLNLVWFHIKKHMGSNLKSFKLKKIKEFIKEGFHSISQNDWFNYTNYVKQSEGLLLSIDKLYESN